jgi:hypothetical protein
MKKDIMLSGLLGGFMIFAWIIISSSILPINGDLPEEIPGDKEIHTMLKNKTLESGIYWMPGHTGQAEGQYPDYDNEPIFYIFYAGATPNTMIVPTIVEILCIFLTTMIAAWLLSGASEKILAKYSRRVLFVTSIGLLFAVYGDLYSQKPLNLILLSSINNLISWTLVGLVLAWRIKPQLTKT